MRPLSVFPATSALIFICSLIDAKAITQGVAYEIRVVYAHIDFKIEHERDFLGGSVVSD